MTNEPTIEHIALGQIRPSKTNPRKHFDEADLLELTESVRSKGVLQPLLVRPDWCIGKDDAAIAQVNGSPPAPEFYEVIAGERRFRAGAAAALERLPAIVRQLSDQETLEIQLIENLQRADLNAIEEAEGYGRLLALRDAQGAPIYTAQLISQKTGKALRTIYGRLKLLQAPASLRAAVEEGRVGHRVGELIGRIPVPEMREQAAREILKPSYQAGPLSFREAEILVRENFMRSLSQAPFDQKDGSLVPIQSDPVTGERTGGGACTDCPMKTGNAPEVFGDLKRPDICTNPKCYAAKSEAEFARLEAAAVADGKKLLSEKEVKKNFEADGHLWFDSDYVKLSEQPDRAECRPELKKIPSWKKLLEKVEAKPPLALARDPRGRVVELVERKLAVAAVNLDAKAKGETSIFGSTGAQAGATRGGRAGEDSAYAREQKAMREKSKLRLAIALEAMNQLIRAVDAKGMIAGFWETIIEVSIEHAGHDGCWLVCKRLGLDPKASNGHTSREGVQGAALEYGLTLPDEKLKLGFLVELLVSRAAKFSTAHYGGGLKSTKSFARVARLYQIDLDAVEKQVAVELKEKKSAKKTAKKGKPERGQSDVKAPPIGTAEHKWKKTRGKKFKCERCGANGEQIENTWPPVMDREFLERPCQTDVAGDVVHALHPPGRQPNETKKRAKPSVATRAKISAGRRRTTDKLTPGARKRLSKLMKERWAARRKGGARK
ncbi:hypothetical protein BH20VER3_BH20VER3_00710 [soil metagenome]